MSDIPTEEPAAPSEWQTEARAAGYGWGDIGSHVAQASQAAQDEGYTPDQVDRYLGYANPAPATNRFEDGWKQNLLNGTALSDGLSAPEPTLNIFDGDWRGDYVGALRRREVKDPQDFADRYAAAALTAAHGENGPLEVADDRTMEGRLNAGVKASDALADALPHPADFVDASLGLSVQPGDAPPVRDTLYGHWRDTGEHPVDAALRANSDPELRDKLLAASGGDPEAAAAADISKAIEPAINAWMKWRSDNIEEGIKAGDKMMTTFRAGKIDEALAHFMETPAGGFAGPTAIEGRVGGSLIGRILNTLKVVDPSAPVGEAVRFDPAAVLSKPDPLLHAEARDEALLPRHEVAKAAEAEGPKRPTYKLVPEEKPSPAYEDADGHKTFQIHKDGEPVGFAEATFPKDRPGVAMLDNIATDERAGSMGPRAVRGLAKQFFEEHPDVDSIEGFRVSGARVREGQGPADAAITREQIMGRAEPAPAEVSALADGYRAQGGMFDYVRALGGDVMANDSGALRLFRTAPQANDYAKFSADREFMEKQWIAGTGQDEATLKRFATNLEPLQKVLNPHMPEFLAEIKKGPGGQPMNTTVGNVIRYMQGRSYGAAMAHDSPLTPLADGVRGINQEVEVMMRDAEARGLHHMNSYYEDYYRQLWKDPNKADEFIRGTGKLGSNASFKERTHITFEDGLAHGLEPAIPDPLQMTLYDVGQKLRYLRKLDMLDDASNAGLVKWRLAPGPGEVQLDRAGTKMAPLTDPATGKTTLMEMHAFGTEGYARSWNNQMGLGVNSHPVSAGVYEQLMYAANTMTQTKLANWLFHGWAVSGGSIAGAIGQGMEEAARGQMLRAAGSLINGASVVGKPVLDVIKGREFQKLALDPASNDPAVKALVNAGLKLDRPDILKTGRAPSVVASIKRNSSSPTELFKAFARQVGDNVANVAGQRDGWLTDRAALAKYGLGVPTRTLQVGLQEMGRIMTTISDPAFGYLIPRVEQGASLLRMRSYLAANPTASEAAIAYYARNVVKDVEGRMGELNLNNVFAPQMVKQYAALSLTSTSWVFGTYRNLANALGFGNVRGQMAFNPVALTSTIGTVAAFAYLNSLMQYAHTGKLPFQTDTPFADMANFRTGGAPNKGGTPRRGMVPSELKEVFDLAKIVATSMGQPTALGKGAWDYAMGKVNPFWQMLGSLKSGEDGLGHQIALMPGGWPRYFKEQFEPIFMNANSQIKKGSGLSPAEVFTGLKEASEFVQDPDTYQSKLAGWRSRMTKMEIARYRKEQAQLEDPGDGYDIPDAKPKGRLGSVRDWAPAGIPRPDRHGTSSGNLRRPGTNPGY